MTARVASGSSSIPVVGHVQAIFLAQRESGERVAVDEARALAGRGLEGDAYLLDGGARAPKDRVGRDLTLIEAEALEALLDETGIELAPWEPRRNVVTRHVRLNDLVGERFRVGEVTCIGRLLNEPCAHLESLTRPGVLRGLVHRGGLRADILSGGWIRVGDPIGRGEADGR